MPYAKAKDGTQLYYKDWGKGAPVVLLHGWPLTGDTFDDAAVHLVEAGHRAIIPDRRGFGRSDQPWDGHDYDTYSDDVAALLEDAGVAEPVALVGFSMGGGEVARFLTKQGKGRVSKAVLISSIPPMLLKSDKNPDGLPMAVFDQLRDGTAYHRSQFYQDITVPFYGFNRPGAKVSQGIRDNWWRQGMMGAAKAQNDCIKVLSESEFFEDLKMIDVPVLVMHGDDDQICPFESSGAKAVKLLKHGTLKLYPGFPHGMPTTHAEQINADLLTFFKAGVATAAA